MGIRFHCPNGHKLNVKSFLAGKKGVCPDCGVKLRIPQHSEPGLGGHDDEDRDDPHHADPVPAPQPVAAAPAPIPVGAVPVPQPTVPKMVAPGSVTAVRPSGVAIPTIPNGGFSALSSPPPMPAPVPAQPVRSAPSYPMPSPAQRGMMPATHAVVPPPPPIGSSDPIAESPLASWFVRPPSGGQFGPARGEVMRKWLNEGRVTADSLVWREGWIDWLAATDAFPQLIQSAPAPFSMLMNSPQSQPGRVYPVAAPKRDNSLAVTIVVVLVILCVLLAGVLFVVLSGGLPTE